MLQQTQVATVIPYYQRFVKRFPDIQSLTAAEMDEVLHHWSGLGYYARGRNLHKAAGIIMRENGGLFPQTLDEVMALPGIGRSTAAAILALSGNQRHAILDGNVKRSLCRFHGIEGYPGARAVEKRLWELAEAHTPDRRIADYTQAIMDLGATLCTRGKPACGDCPMRSDCFARKHGQTATLPWPKPRRQRPFRQCHMLVMLDPQQQVALFKRPAKGIWGGLYSLPEFPTAAACEEQLQNYQLENLDSLRRGPDILHKFSHFDLHITPQVLPLSADSLQRILDSSFISTLPENSGVMQENTLYHLGRGNHGNSAGIPAPVQKILDSLAAGTSSTPDSNNE